MSSHKTRHGSKGKGKKRNRKPGSIFSPLFNKAEEEALQEQKTDDDNVVTPRNMRGQPSKSVIFLIFLTNNIPFIQSVCDSLYSDGKLPVDAEVFKNKGSDEYCKACIRYMTAGISNHVRIFVEPLQHNKKEMTNRDRERMENRQDLLRYFKITCDALDIKMDVEPLPTMTCTRSPRTKRQQEYEDAFEKKLETVDVQGQRKNHKEFVNSLVDIENTMLSIISDETLPSNAMKPERSRETLLADFRTIYENLHLIIQEDIQCSSHKQREHLLSSERRPYEKSMIRQLSKVDVSTIASTDS